MRILFATTNAFIPDHFSGQNRTLLELAARLTKMGHEPVVLAASAAGLGRSAVIRDRNYGFRLFRAENPLKSLSALCVTLRPDIVLAADGHYEGFIDAVKPLRVPLAVWFFQLESHFFTQGAPDLLYLASSRFLAKRASSLFGIDAEVVPPFIDSAKYQKQRRGKRVLFVNPVRQKGVEIAFSLAQQRPDLPFTFVESWGLSEQWRRSCFERALRCGNIEWIPRSTDMAAVFDRTRLLLVPRYSEEGYCRVVTEAQLRGVPALVSDRGSLAETVGSGGSVLDIDAGVNAWLEQLDRYVDDDEHYQRVSEQACLHAARPEIAEQGVVERMLDLLASRVSNFQARRFGRGKT